MEDMDHQIRAVDERLPNDGTANFLSWIKAAIEEHGFVVVTDFENNKDIPFIVNRLQGEQDYLYGALRWLVDDITDAGEARNPETGELYDSVENAMGILDTYEKEKQND